MTKQLINSQADLDKYINELNQYAQELINNVRDQFGTENVRESQMVQKI